MITFWVLSFRLSFGVIIYFMLSLNVIIWCYHFSQFENVIIFVLSFFLVQHGCYHLCYHIMLSYNVISFCYHFPPFFFFLKTWHTHLQQKLKTWKLWALYLSHTRTRLFRLINTQNWALRAPPPPPLQHLCSYRENPRQIPVWEKYSGKLQFLKVQQCHCRWHCEIEMIFWLGFNKK
jgi:hypothetical protein